MPPRNPAMGHEDGDREARRRPGFSEQMASTRQRRELFASGSEVQPAESVPSTQARGAWVSMPVQLRAVMSGPDPPFGRFQSARGAHSGTMEGPRHHQKVRIELIMPTASGSRRKRIEARRYLVGGASR